MAVGQCCLTPTLQHPLCRKEGFFLNQITNLQTKHKDIDFVFASSRVRALQTKAFTIGQTHRLISAKTREEELKILASCGFFDDNNSTLDYEEVLTQTLLAAYHEVEQLSPDKSLVRLMRLKYDAHNLKVLVKSTQITRHDHEVEILLSPLGNVPTSVAIAQFSAEKLTDFPPRFATATLEAREHLAATHDPQMVDILLDRALAAEMLTVAAETATPFIQKFVAAQIDLANIRAFVRAKRMNKDAFFLGKILSPGGSFSISVLSTAYLKGIDGLEPLVANSPYGRFLATPLATLKSAGGSLTSFELSCDNALTSFVSDSHFISFGPAVLFAFLYSKELQVQAARLILASKAALVSSSEITERLREIYAS